MQCRFDASCNSGGLLLEISRNMHFFDEITEESASVILLPKEPTVQRFQPGLPFRIGKCRQCCKGPVNPTTPAEHRENRLVAVQEQISDEDRCQNWHG